MNSFYGGKQGRTYHIVLRYDCVCMANFVQAFLSANTNTEKEYVKINSNIDSIENLKKGSLIYFEQNDSYYILTKDVIKEENSYYIITQELNQEQNLERIPIIITNIDWLNEYGILIQGMVLCFAKGGSYSKVNYGLYVIIDTIKNLNHKDDLENGLLFRRGFDYITSEDQQTLKPNMADYYIENINEATQEEEKIFDKTAWQAAWSNWVENVGGGAIYVGQIVGPEGNAPELFPISWEEMETIENLKRTINPVSYTYGWTLENGYDDTVKVASVTIEDIDGNVTGAKIAFDIPMHTIEVSGESVSPYISTRSHEDHASNITDEVSITKDNIISNDEGKIIGYKNLIHLHSATGKDAQIEENNELISTPHPFYYNYNIAIPKGIHGKDISNIVIEKGSSIPKTIKTYLYDIKTYLYDIKTYLYDENYPLGTEGAELHKIPIYWTELDEDFIEEYKHPIYWTEQDEGFIEEYKHPIYLELDSDGNQLIDNDLYITFDIIDYDYLLNSQGEKVTIEDDIVDQEKSELGYTISHNGRLPFKVINQIKEEFTNRNFYDINSSENAILGQIYQISEERSLYAICIQAGSVTQEIKNWLQNAKDRVVAEQWPRDRKSTSSIWHTIIMNSEAAAGFEIDYRAGLSDFVSTHFLDYLYLDNYSNVHAVYTKYNINGKTLDERILTQKDVNIGFIDSIASISENDGLFIFSYYGGRQETITLNYVVDIQRSGNDLYVLYSNTTYRKAYVEANPLGLNTKYKILKYTGINPNSRYAEQNSQKEDYDDGNYGYYYIKIDASIPESGYKFFGKVELKDLIWIADDTVEEEYTNEECFNNISYVGQYADVEKILWEKNKLIYLNQKDDAIENRIYKAEIIRDPNLEELYSPFIMPLDQQGRIVNVAVENQATDSTIIVLYAYNFVKSKKPIKYTSVPGLENLITTGKVAYSYWYDIQTMDEIDVNPNRLFVIDFTSNTTDGPQSGWNLNTDGIWFVKFDGHDQLGV